VLVGVVMGVDVVAGGVDVVGGVVAGGVVVAGLEPEGDETGATEVEPVAPELALKQLESGPALILKAAEDPVAPVLSRMVNPIEVPAAMFTFHVKDVPVRPVNCSNGWALGSLPGRMLKKYGGVPPDQVRRMGWQTTTFAGVLIIGPWASALPARNAAVRRDEKNFMVALGNVNEGAVGV